MSAKSCMVFASAVALLPAVASAQIARVEVHPVQSVTMSTDQAQLGRLAMTYDAYRTLKL